MEKLMNNFRKIALFKIAVILLMFLLPFVNVSCQGLDAQTFTGMDLVLGSSLNQSSSASALQNALSSEGIPAAMIALVCAVGALASAMVTRGWLHVVAVSGLSTMGAMSLLWLHLTISADVLQRGQGALTLTWNAAYWMALCFFASLALLGAIGITRRFDRFYSHKGHENAVDVSTAAGCK